MSFPYLLLRRDELGHALEEPTAAPHPYLPRLRAHQTEILSMRVAVGPLDDSLPEHHRLFLKEPEGASHGRLASLSVGVVASIQRIRLRDLDAAFLAHVFATVLAEVPACPQHRTKLIAAETAGANATTVDTATYSAAASLPRCGRQHVLFHILQSFHEPADPLLL